MRQHITRLVGKHQERQGFIDIKAFLINNLLAVLAATLSAISHAASARFSMVFDFGLESRENRLSKGCEHARTSTY
jgi:hypothetical protein